MPTPLAPQSPERLKAVLDQIGYTVDRESEMNWAMVRGYSTIILPKIGDYASFEIINYALKEAGLTESAFIGVLNTIDGDATGAGK